MRFFRGLRRVPVTSVVVILFVVLALVTGPIHGPSAEFRRLFGLDVSALSRHEWWSYVTADFFVDNLAQLVIVVIAAAVCLGASERLMGSRRMLLAFLVTGVLASALGVALEQLGLMAQEYWADSVRSVVTLDPLTPIVGTIAAASAYAGVLWRRRIRVFTVAATLVMLLYSGQPSDLYRLIAVGLGIGLGAIMTRQRIHVASVHSSHHEIRVLLATVAAIFAIGPVITVISHGKFGLLSPLGAVAAGAVPDSRSGGVACTLSDVGQSCSEQLGSHAGQGIIAVLFGLLPLLVMLVGALGLLRGRRAAVYLVAAVSAANGLLAGFYFGVIPVIGQSSGLAKIAGNSPEFTLWMIANALVPIGFAAVLILLRHHFVVRARPQALRRFFATVTIAAASSAALFVGLGWLLRDQFRPAVGLGDLLYELPERFVPVSFLVAEQREFRPASILSRLVYDGVGPLFWLVLVIAAVILLRGESVVAGRSGDGAQLRALLRQGGSSMSFLMTWVGNSYWFDSTRQLCIAYRVANGCAVTTGEPLGRVADREAALEEFIRFCDAHAWRPVFYSIHGDWAEVVRALGWSTAVIAEETLIDPATWQMTGKKWQDVRSSVNRAAREGVKVVWDNWAGLGPRLTNQITEISELWVVEKRLPELGFTLGGLDELRDDDVLLGLAVDATGRVQAVTSWLPCWRDGQLIGYTLDFMRRRVDGMNGVMEFLIAEAAVRAKLDGLEFLSLSGAPLAISTDEEETEPLGRVLALLGRSLEPVYGFRSLFTFKQKFQPRLEPLYFAYRDPLVLPAIGVAISRCYLPQLTLRDTAALIGSMR